MSKVVVSSSSNSVDKAIDEYHDSTCFVLIGWDYKVNKVTCSPGLSKNFPSKILKTKRDISKPKTKTKTNKKQKTKTKTKTNKKTKQNKERVRDAM